MITLNKVIRIGLVQYDWYHKKRKFEHKHGKREDIVKAVKMAVCKPRREA